MVSGYPNYKYKIRTNSTKDLGDNGVYTADLTLQTALNLKQYQTQINSGMVGTNTFMNNLILQ